MAGFTENSLGAIPTRDLQCRLITKVAELAGTQAPANIDRDILTCPVEEVKGIKVEQTCLGGKVVYEKK